MGTKYQEVWGIQMTQQKPNDLWEDMASLNSLYEELMWDHSDVLEFNADYENNRIIIRNKSREGL